MGDSTLPLLRVPSADFSAPDMLQIDTLIADNSQLALQAAVEVALSLGWQVNAVDSGEAVLTQLRERRSGKMPHVVVLDWNMPGMDGLVTAKAIRDSVPQDEYPIVIMATAYSPISPGSPPDTDLVDAILPKPVTASALYNAVMDARRKRVNTAGRLHALPPTPSQGLADVRLLVVDDSDINRDVAQRILSEQGAKVVLAEDGSAALDYLLANPMGVDLVLMDVQMPVMDGIEATRQLRRMSQFNNLPIVALTAGAFKSQQEAARAAGMTDFISKPFDIPSTIALIQRLRRRPETASAPVSHMPDTAPIVQEAVQQPLDTSVMNVAQGLQIWSDVQRYRDYLRRFADTYGGAIATMRTSLAMGDRPAVAALTHKLAGVAANMALPETYRLAGEAERVLAEGYDPTLVLVRLDDALRRALAAIEHFAPHVVLPDGADQAAQAAAVLLPEARTTVEAQLLELLAALDTDNPSPVEAILAKLAQHLPERDLAAIRSCVRDFDFRGAEISCRSLAAQNGITIQV